jgi:tetratricopeptide (TPR) repeat protein
LFVVAAVGATFLWRTATPEVTRGIETHSEYMNTQSGIKYVGDAACTRCHADIAATYRKHPMGRSLAPIAEVVLPGATTSIDEGRFEASGLEYAVSREGSRLIHQETRHDSSGRAISTIAADVAYAIGSGRQACSFLIERDGFLFESPITWYAQDRHWGLSPGYEKRVSRFERPILAECLFCHANRVERVTSAVNRYQTPIFKGHAIGCERCHGPGELHIRQPKVVDGRDITIVNPADLPPTRRDAICEQCHLIGPKRIARVDKRSEDFRPGLEFYRFWSVFVPKSTAGANKFASQAEQMHDSQCYRASNGGLGCISCHDPHVMPAPEIRVAYFRERCLECHGDRGCSLPERARLERQPANDCVGCHMPRSSSSNNVHVATTNHRIPRRSSLEAVEPVSSERGESRDPPLVHFHRDFLDAQDRAQTERDRGMALVRGGGESALREALPLLQAAAAARPDDLSAVESLGEVLGRLRRPEEGLAAYKTVLGREPTRQTALEGAAHLASRAGRYNESIESWKRAIAINPWRSDFHADMALAAIQIRDWSTAALACDQALRLNPNLVQVRKWLVQCNLHLGNQEAAQREFERLLEFDPPDRADLLRRFSSLVQPQ